MRFAMCKFQYARSKQKTDHENGSVYLNGPELSERSKASTSLNISAQKQNAFSIVRMANGLYRQFRDF
jgi:hypothetical protein